MSLRIFLLALFLLSPALRAEEAAPIETASATKAPSVDTAIPASPSELLSSAGLPKDLEERNAMVLQAQGMHEDARVRRENAEKTHAATKTACWKRFLVSSCLEDARLAYRKEIQLAKHQDREAQILERNVKKYDAADHAKQLAEENAKRDADNARKAEEFKAKQAEKQKQ